MPTISALLHIPYANQQRTCITNFFIFFFFIIYINKLRADWNPSFFNFIHQRVFWDSGNCSECPCCYAIVEYLLFFYIKWNYLYLVWQTKWISMVCIDVEGKLPRYITPRHASYIIFLVILSLEISSNHTSVDYRSEKISVFIIQFISVAPSFTIYTSSICRGVLEGFNSFPRKNRIILCMHLHLILGIKGLRRFEKRKKKDL